MLESLKRTNIFFAPEKGTWEPCQLFNEIFGQEGFYFGLSKNKHKIQSVTLGKHCLCKHRVTAELPHLTFLCASTDGVAAAALLLQNLFFDNDQ